jgi:adenylate cyclase
MVDLDEPDFEVERRFLVSDTSIVDGMSWDLILQAYVFSLDDYAVRIRLTRTLRGDTWEDVSAKVTVKGPRFGIKREEYERDISTTVARGIIERCANVIEKKRYQVVTDQTWDVDEFLGENAGLWIAELESRDPETIKTIRRPGWCSREVTSDRAYNNENLAVHPYRLWSSAEEDVAP